MGTVSGRDRVEMGGVAAGFSADSMMLTNSVSGDVIVVVQSIRCSAGEKVTRR
jgi:hypothetical protein